MSTPAMSIGLLGNNLSEIYTELLSGGADLFSSSSTGNPTLIIGAGAILQASPFAATNFQTPTGPISLATVENNASILADIAYFCNTHSIDVKVEANLSAVHASSFYIGSGPAINEVTFNWAQAAALAGLPITSVEDVDEAGILAYTHGFGISPQNLATDAASEALSVDTLKIAYQDVANTAELGSTAWPTETFTQGSIVSTFTVAANGITSATQANALLINSASLVINDLTVGDMESGGGTFTDPVLQDVSSLWNNYDNLANGGTVDLYYTWTNTNGKIAEPNNSNEYTEDPADTINNATTVWFNGSVIDAAAYGGIVNAGSFINTNTWVPSASSLPSGWKDPATGGSDTKGVPLYEILESGGVYYYVYERPIVLGTSTEPDPAPFTFVTSDTGSGAEWQEWLQGLSTLVNQGTIQLSPDVDFSIGTNDPTLSLNVVTEAFAPAISNLTEIGQIEAQAFQLAGFGVPISNLSNEDWKITLPVGSGLVSSPSSLANAEAEITALYTLYASGSITAQATGGVALSGPGDLIEGLGSASSVGSNFSLSYTGPDLSTARLARISHK